LSDFCHLHVHSTYSVLDGINRLDSLVARCKELGMSACALTDHGNLHGALDFYKECRKQGVKPIIGIEAYITNDPDGMEEGKTRDNHHMVLIAQNAKGFSNLCWLLSNANINNFYYKPRIHINTLKARAEGLIATSACLGGWIAKHCIFDQQYKSSAIRDPDAMAHTIAELDEAFQGRFYLELQDQDMWEQDHYNEMLLSRKYKRYTISSDAHYLKKEDQATHKMIMAQQLKKTIDEYESGSEMKYGSGFYIRSPEEMLEGAKRIGCESAFHNTMEIAGMCSLELELGKYKMPEFDVTKTVDYEEFKRYKTTNECKAR
jgi:DNA polymerase III subunit alpha